MPFAHLFDNAYMQSIWMMYLYGVGCASVFGVLFAMHWRAYRMREQLELDDIELALTRGSLRSHGISCGIAVLSIAVAATMRNAPIAGMVYALNAPLHIWNGWHTGSRADRLKKQMSSAAATASRAGTPPPPAA